MHVLRPSWLPSRAETWPGRAGGNGRGDQHRSNLRALGSDTARKCGRVRAFLCQLLGGKLGQVATVSARVSIGMDQVWVKNPSR